MAVAVITEDGLLVPASLRTVAETLDHPEGICWSPVDKVLYAGGEAGQLYRFGIHDGDVELVAQIPGGFLLGIAVDGEGRVYACDIGNKQVHRIDCDGRVSSYGDSLDYPNYPVFGPDGSLYVSDSGSWDGVDGRIVRISPGGATEPLPTPPLRFPNGLALHDDYLYVVESTGPAIVRLPLTGGEPELVVALDRVVPDGLAFDAEGGLWISCWQPNRILRLDPSGRLDVVVDDWSGIQVLTPNNLVFVGTELVFPALAGDFVRAFDAGVAGQPLEYPRGV